MLLTKTQIISGNLIYLIRTFMKIKKFQVFILFNLIHLIIPRFVDTVEHEIIY